MARIFDGDTLVIASHNTGKVREIAALLGDHVRHCPSAADYDVVEPEETGDSFAANAELKARWTASRSGLPALADDSGLCVDALGGKPGIHSARWAVLADGSRDFAFAMEKVEAALEDLASAQGVEAGTVDRSAQFVCALCLAWPDGHCETVTGVVQGRLVWPPRGTRGFGYDPVFEPVGHTVTFGEMDPDGKHRISHRADAFAKIAERCFS